MLLCIDPGLRACGVALFDDGRLYAAALVQSGSKAARAEAWSAMGQRVCEWSRLNAMTGEVDRLAIELPQVYERGHQTERKRGTDPNDLIQLAAVVGTLCHVFESAAAQIVYLPAEWKGQVPKEIMHERARKRLSAEEMTRLPILAKSTLHNVLDAVSIGLVVLERM